MGGGYKKRCKRDEMQKEREVSRGEGWGEEQRVCGSTQLKELEGLKKQ